MLPLLSEGFPWVLCCPFLLCHKQWRASCLGLLLCHIEWCSRAGKGERETKSKGSNYFENSFFRKTTVKQPSPTCPGGIDSYCCPACEPFFPLDAVEWIALCVAVAGSQQVTCSTRLLWVPHSEDAHVGRLKSAGKLWWLGVSGIMFASIWLLLAERGLLNIH